MLASTALGDVGGEWRESLRAANRRLALDLVIIPLAAIAGFGYADRLG